MITDAPERIPIPAEFPVDWQEPTDGDRFFERELQHLPGQMTELEVSLAARLYRVGFNGGCAHYELPVRNTFRCINTYAYQAIGPVSHDPEVLEDLGKRSEERLGKVLDRNLGLWDSEYLPEIQESIEFWDSFDPAAASNDELVAHLDATIPRFERAWELHFIAVIPALVGMSMFDDFCAEALGGSDPFGAFRLLQGLDNHSLQADRALYGLSRTAAAEPAVRSALEREDTDAVLAELDSSETGRAFRSALDEYLSRFGKRHDGYFSCSKPSWTEDPTTVLDNLRDYIVQEERDPEAELAQLAAERERALSAVREALASRPIETREQFEFLLRAAQDGSVLQENHNMWVDGRVSHEIRQLTVALGSRLDGDGAIDAWDDVYHLSLEELREALLSGGDLRPTVRRRKEELARFADVSEPPVLGTLPPGPPPDDPIARAVFKMFGGVPPESGEADVVTGLPGSGGVVTGLARVVHSLDEAGTLEGGEVLVTETTSPPWTPLFVTAAAVVTDTGGILSHCAVVAREYLIPAVVGTKRGTAAIRTGDRVEVNGDEGTVRVTGSS